MENPINNDRVFLAAVYGLLLLFVLACGVWVVIDVMHKSRAATPQCLVAVGHVYIPCQEGGKQ